MSCQYLYLMLLDTSDCISKNKVLFLPRPCLYLTWSCCRLPVNQPAFCPWLRDCLTLYLPGLREFKSHPLCRTWILTTNPDRCNGNYRQNKQPSQERLGSHKQEPTIKLRSALFFILFVKRNFVQPFPKTSYMYREKNRSSIGYLSLKPKTLGWPYIDRNLGKNEKKLNNS